MSLRPHLLSLALTISSLALAAPKATIPLAEAKVKALFKKPDAVNHLTIYAVDETCFGADALDGSPSGTSTEDMSIGEVTMKQLNFNPLDGSSASKAFPKFKAWTARFKSATRRLVFGVSMLGDTQYGYRAQCVVAKPVLASDDFGRVTNKKDPSIDKAMYRIGIMQSGLDKVKALGPEVHRLVVVYDEDQIVTHIPVPDLRAFEESPVVVTLVKF